MDVEGDAVIHGEAPQPLRRKMDIHRRRDLPDDMLLRIEPGGEVEREALAPDADRGRRVPEREDQPDGSSGLVSGSLDEVLGGEDQLSASGVLSGARARTDQSRRRAR